MQDRNHRTEEVHLKRARAIEPASMPPSFQLRIASLTSNYIHNCAGLRRETAIEAGSRAAGYQRPGLGPRHVSAEGHAEPANQSAYWAPCELSSSTTCDNVVVTRESTARSGPSCEFMPDCSEFCLARIAQAPPCLVPRPLDLCDGRQQTVDCPDTIQKGHLAICCRSVAAVAPVRSET